MPKRFYDRGHYFEETIDKIMASVFICLCIITGWMYLSTTYTLTWYEGLLPELGLLTVLTLKGMVIILQWLEQRLVPNFIRERFSWRIRTSARFDKSGKVVSSTSYVLDTPAWWTPVLSDLTYALVPFKTILGRKTTSRHLIGYWKSGYQPGPLERLFKL
ncbi:MAG: hypothetical protein WC289_00560 [Patescibacteria group bacterium]|jgi:hypothetical protein